MANDSRPKIKVNWPQGYGAPESNSAEAVGIGWQVVDPDGNVVQSGGISIAQADGKLAQLLDQFSTEGEQE